VDETFRDFQRNLLMRRRLFLLAVALTAATSLGADWRQFRGLHGSGTSEETGLPVTWSEKENLVWRAKLPGPGTSCPIVVGKRVYLTCYSGYGLGVFKKDEKEPDDPKDLLRHLVCIDRANGTILWTKEFRPLNPESKYYAHEGDFHGYASSTPASDGERLYVFFGASGLYCFDLDGKELWHKDVGKNTRNWGSSNSPVLYQDLVIVNASVECDAMIAFDKVSGKEVWRAKGISASWNTPVLADAPQGPELVVNIASAVLGLDPASGKELWRVKGFNGYVCPSVVVHQDVVYVVRGSVLAIKAGGRGDVTDSHVLWRGKGNSQISSPVYHDGRLYWLNRSEVLSCIDAKTGTTLYRERLSKGGEFFASALVADGKIYCVSRFSGTYVVAEAAKFQELARNTFADDASRTNASPIAHDGCLLLRTDQYLYCLGRH
jgi:outer membrane protein assembly factor BamB